MPTKETHAEDPKYDDEHVVESRKSIANWRDSILQNLKKLGTHKSCEAISRISSELPDLDWLKWTLFEAQNITRRNTWVPPQPRDILKMVSNQQSNSTEQKQAEVVEILQRISRDTSSASKRWIAAIGVGGAFMSVIFLLFPNDPHINYVAVMVGLTIASLTYYLLS